MNPDGFFKALLDTPSPSGYEQQIQKVVATYLETCADKITTDLHGNLIAIKNPDAKFKVMFAGHCDQIGMLVHHIDDDGFLYFQELGGWDPQVLIGQTVTIWGSKPVQGIVGRKPIHLLTDEERKTVPKTKDLWIDIGAANKKEATEFVQVGDAVTTRLGVTPLLNNMVYGSAMDDKAGLFVVAEAFRRASPPKDVGLYCVSTVQEEVGLRGAKTSCFGIDPQVGIAVDVTFATDCPTIDKKEYGDIVIGKGPVVYRGPNMNPRVVDNLVQVAKKNDIPYQLAADAEITGTDANVMQSTRSGVATGLVSIPNRYMHSPVEVISTKDIHYGAELLADFASQIKSKDSFVP